MSKKKAFSGSTMSLKDFHGGSIPSDLPLPSAPGLIVRSGSDQQISTPWGNNLIRSDNRARPKSSGAARNLDEKASFLSHPAPIGQNFDEDERKPLDGISVPRRTISDDSIRATTPPIRQESKPDLVSSARPSDGNPVWRSPNLAPHSSPVRLVGATPVGVNLPDPGGNNRQTVVNSYQNAWGMRKELMGIGETGASSVLSGPNAESKFAQASALEKVSSGKWQSKNPLQLLPHLLVSRDNCSNMSNGVDLASERGDYDATWGSHAERGRIAEDEIQRDGNELLGFARERPPICAEEALTEQRQPVAAPEISERSKLKLVPRSKPLEISEKDRKQGHQQSIDSGKVKNPNEMYGNTTSPKLVSAVGEGGNQPVDRPKLNLKPRSKPLEQSEGSFERERNTLFGGARPRELVLKERGIDDLAINSLDLRQMPNRMNDSPKLEAVRGDHSVPNARRGERTENVTLDKRTGRDAERKDDQMEREKADIQRNRRNDNWRSSMDAEKQLLQQDWQAEPDTWRKPAEQPRPPSPDASGIRYGKVASALELAQAFSRPFSDPKTDDRISDQRGFPGRNQMPFSRLTDARELYSSPTTAPTARHHINGY
ncbi:hypothetical protein L1049_025105 [Liquidambar formosana]|uniref:Uncharacterized protein n=1 Tax=Liquidambar formosana TaxID=63359 RepID=A0AAP0S2I8_LIQFO